MKINENELKSLLQRLLKSADFINHKISNMLNKPLQLCSNDIYDYYCHILNEKGEDIEIQEISTETEISLKESLWSELQDYLELCLSNYTSGLNTKTIQIQYEDVDHLFDPVDIREFTRIILLSASIFGVDKVVANVLNWRAEKSIKYNYCFFVNDSVCIQDNIDAEISHKKLKSFRQLPDLFHCFPILYDLAQFHDDGFLVPEKSEFNMKGVILEFLCEDIPFLMPSKNKEMSKSSPMFKFNNSWHKFNPKIFSYAMMIASNSYVNPIFGWKRFDSLTFLSNESTQIIERPYYSYREPFSRLVINNDFLNLAFNIYKGLINLNENRMRDGIEYWISSIRPNIDEFKVSNLLYKRQRIVDLRSAVESIFLEKYKSGVKKHLRLSNRFGLNITKSQIDMLVDFYSFASAISHVNLEEFPNFEKTLELFESTQHLCSDFIRTFLIENNY